MPRSKKSIEERINIKDDEIQKLLDRANQLKAQKRQLEQRKKAEDRKARTHSLIVIGGVVSSVLNRDFVEGDDMRLMNFLKQQERNGNYFSKAMNKGAPDTAKKSDGQAGSQHTSDNADNDNAGLQETENGSDTAGGK